ncbi:MAG: phosphatase PAP2 family protein [Solirubrobacteraceae bacterium]
MRPLAARLALGFIAFVLVGSGIGGLWVAIAGSYDYEAPRELADQRTAALTSAARVLTWAGSAWVLVPLALLCCALLIRAGLRRDAVAVAVSLGGAMLLSNIVKLLVSRPRPSVPRLQAVNGSSFPSGHATQASAFWFSLVLVLQALPVGPRLLRVAWTLAAMLVAAVAVSRVYLGVHYPSDVLAGVLLGAGWAVFVSRCTRQPRSP